MKFFMEIEIGSDSMKTYGDIAEAIKLYIGKPNRRLYPGIPTAGEVETIMDRTGNAVGKWEVADNAPAPCRWEQAFNLLLQHAREGKGFWCEAGGTVDGDIYYAHTAASAAPCQNELLAALKGLLPDGWDGDDTMDHIPGVKAAREAIAKAEGQ